MSKLFNVEAANVLFDHIQELDEHVENTHLVCNSPDRKIRQLLHPFDIKHHSKLNGEPVAFTLNWLSPEVCQQLIKLAPREAYTVNEDEPEDAQIPEYILESEAPEVYTEVLQAFRFDLSMIVRALTGFDIEYVESIQLAVYEAAGGVNQGTPHTDDDSDITITVALNDDYVGGGLNIITGGVYSETVHIPKQPRGTATIFKGRTTLHYGLPVTEGKRHLLVFWCKI